MIEDPRAIALLMELKGVKAAKDFEGKYCEEENGKLIVKRIPRSTKYRLLRRLVEMGYLELVEGVDKRYRYYRLSSKGELYKQKLLRAILDDLKEALDPYARLLANYRLEIPLDKFKRIVCKYGIPPSLLLKLLNARIEDKLLDKVVVIEMV